MAGINLDKLDAVIREELDKLLITIYPSQSMFWDLFNKEKRPVVTDEFQIALKYARAAGFGARFADKYDEDLPDAGAAKYIRTKIKVKEIYAAMRVSGLAAAATKNKEAAIVSAIVQAAADASETMTWHLERMAIGDGSGRLAQVNGAVSGGTTITIDHPNYDDPTIFLEEGMRIEIYNGTTKEAPTSGSLEITAVDPDNKQITVSQAVTVSDNAWIYVEGDVGVYNSALVSKEFMGLLGIVDNDVPPLESDFQGINPTTYKWWKAHVEDPGALTSLSLSLIQQTLDNAMKKGTGKLYLAFCDPALRRSYVALLEAKQEITQPIVSQAGWSGLAYVSNGRKIAIYDTYHAPKNTILFVDQDAIKWFLLEGINWLDYGGTSTLVAVGKDAIYRYLKAYGNFGTIARNRHAKLVNVQ